MAVNMELLGPRNKEEEEIYAIEALVFSVQAALHRAMTRKGATNKDLAERLGMTPARVSQILSSKGANLTLKTIARIQHALGEEFELLSKNEIEALKVASKPKTIVFDSNRYVSSVWKDRTAHNSNERLHLKAA